MWSTHFHHVQTQASARRGVETQDRNNQTTTSWLSNRATEVMGSEPLFVLVTNGISQNMSIHTLVWYCGPGSRK